MTKKEPDLRWQAILRFVYITTSKRADNGADKIYLPFWKTRYVDVIKTKQKQLLHLFHISGRDNGGIRQAQPNYWPFNQEYHLKQITISLNNTQFCYNYIKTHSNTKIVKLWNSSSVILFSIYNNFVRPYCYCK